MKEGNKTFLGTAIPALGFLNKAEFLDEDYFFSEEINENSQSFVLFVQ